jgi:1A family penicillin-binding protein
VSARGAGALAAPVRTAASSNKKKKRLKFNLGALSAAVSKLLFRPKRVAATPKAEGKGDKGHLKLRRLLRFGVKAATILCIVGFFAAAAAFIYFSKDIPDPSKIADRSVDQSTQIFDRTGTVLLYQIHGDEKRTVVPLNQISLNLVHATVATEDKNFYNHHGIDPKGILRAILKDVTKGEKAQGASTITQQLIKLSVLSSEKTATRKIKEIILALETEQKFSKDQIIEMYLNQIPYGSNLYGAEVASQTFFGKSAKDLDIGEAAMLAAIPQSATYYFPYGAHPDALETRRKFVIDQMLEEKYITPAEADQAKAEDVFSRLKPFVSEIKAPHFVMYIKDQLVNEYGQDTVEKGGLKVYTTLDYGMQQIAEDAVKKGVEYNAKVYNASNAALVATDPKTGQILAMVGSKDYFDIKAQGNVNVAISSRQPGSSFKPFVYATDFAKGYTPSTILFDVPTDFGPDGSGKDFEPKNYNLQYNGPVTMRSALARSLNIPAVKALYLAGINPSIQTAHNLGITTLNDNGKYGLSLVLGTGEVKLLDMTGAYGVFANEGKRNDVTGILKIQDAKGKVLKEYASNPKQVLDSEVARNITSVLSDNAARTPTFGARSKLYFPDRPVAAKTGTTSDYKDAWTIGYTPSISVGVWAGNNSGKVMNAGGGVSAATPIWNDFLARALAGKPAEKFTEPQPITTKKAVLNGSSTNEVTVTVDKACGGEKLASADTPDDQKEQKTFLEVHNILYYVNKDDPQGDYPQHPQDDPQFARWESGVLAWAQDNMANAGVNGVVPTETCSLHGGDNVPDVKINSPSDNAIIKGGVLNISADASSPNGIKQVEFYLDDNLLKIDTDSPYEGSYRLGGDVQNGIHSLKVKAYDDIGNSAAKEVSVIINDGSGGESALFLKPLAGNDFPLTLSAAVSSDSFQRVEFYYQLDSIYDADGNLVSKPGPSHKIGEDQDVSGDNLCQVSWSEDKSYFISGKYKLYALLYTEDGKQYRSNERYVEIK